MEHVIASYLKEIRDKKDWILKGQHRFRLGFSRESQVIMVCQDIADLSKASDIVPHDWLRRETETSGVDPRVVVWIREFLLGCTQRVRVGWHLSEEVRVTSEEPQGSVLGLLLFLVM
jgi:hypothetical protein